MFENLDQFLDYYTLNKNHFPEYLCNQELLGNKVCFLDKNMQEIKWEDYNPVILGLPEMRNSGFEEEANSPDKIREELYKLYAPQGTNLLDLGNLKKGANIKDSYSIIREFILDLLTKNRTIIILGGSKDLLYPIAQAYEKNEEEFSLTTSEPRLHLSEADTELTQESTYLSTVLTNPRLFHYTNIGLQTYLNPPSLIKNINNRHSVIRLGIARSQISECEPVIRDSNIFGIDIASIKQSDAPGAPGISIHGFYGEEMCQLAKYAGISDKISTFGVFNYLPSKDKNNQTAALTAQIAWHFIQSFPMRQQELLPKQIKTLPKHRVHIEDLSEEIIFYHSPKTDRRWFEVEYSRGNEELSKIISCSLQDFEIARNNQIPPRWWKFHQKLNSPQKNTNH
ncbi:MAG: hypothetical protein CSB06_00850 [Bacteroidia bacterium]|nr:MAG: hypothetical protein CSB06_00850 [Bacteroidia bacterium]